MSAVPVEPSTHTALDHLRALQHPLHCRGMAVTTRSSSPNTALSWRQFQLVRQWSSCSIVTGRFSSKAVSLSVPAGKGGG
jgi:hypothetical protein